MICTHTDEHMTQDQNTPIDIWQLLVDDTNISYCTNCKKKPL